MNIETLRQVSQIEPSKNVLHIGEDNAKYWLDSYMNSRFQKVFWTSPEFYTRGYDTSNLERATVERYTNPWYYFGKCRIKGDGLLTNGMDESYYSDLDFRMAFDTENIKAIVIDENPSKKGNVELFVERAKVSLNLCRPEMIYVRDGLDSLVDEYATKKGLVPTYMFEVGINRTLNQVGNLVCSYTVYTKGTK